MKALKLVLSIIHLPAIIIIIIALLILTSCKKHIDGPRRLQPIISTRITCLKWGLVTKTVGRYTFTNYQCIEKRIDTFIVFQ